MVEVKPKIIVPARTRIKLQDANFWLLDGLEEAARVSYQSFGNKTDDGESAKKLLGNCKKNGHFSVFEHESLTLNLIVDRGVSMELLRHRIASYTHESTRYVKYDKSDMEFMKMIEFNPVKTPTPEEQEAIDVLHDLWVEGCEHSEKTYCKMMERLGYYKTEKLLKLGPPETARSVLNNSLKSEMVITRNIRNAIEFFMQRCDKHAHPHMKEIAIPMMKMFQTYVPVLFDDIPYDEEFYEQYIGDWHNYIEYK